MSALDAVTYEDRDVDLVRFRPSDQDGVFAAILADFLARGPAERDVLRRDLDEADLEKVSLFSLRRALSATRTLSSAAALEALDAQLLSGACATGVPPAEMKVALYAYRSIGNDPETLADRFDDARAGEALALALDALTRVSSWAEIGFAPVTTHYGSGLLALPRPRGWNSGGSGAWGGGFAALPVLSFAPVLHDDEPGFEPRGNLAALAVRLADDLERAGWSPRPMLVEGLASSWFDPEAPHGYVPSNACVTFSVGREGSGIDPLGVWVAELEETDELDDLVAAANDPELSGGLTLAAGRGGRLVLLAATPSFDDPDEVSTIDLEEFATVVGAALDDPSTW
jgi:hypothetical protein